LSSGQNQGITTLLPARWMPTGRAQATSASAGQRAMPVKVSDNDPDRARRFRDAALPYLDDVLYAGALSLARRLRRRGRGAGMLLRALKAFRQLSRAGDEAVAVCDPAQCLPRRVRSAWPTHRPAMSGFAHSAEQVRSGRRRRKRRKPRSCGAGRRHYSPPDRALAEPFPGNFVLREIQNLSYARSPMSPRCRSAP